MAMKFDIKGLAVEHGEKAVLGIVVLLILSFLATARWSSYGRRPAEFTEKINQGRQTLQSNPLTEAEAERLGLAAVKTQEDDVAVSLAIPQRDQPAALVAAALNDRLDVARFELTTRFQRGLYDRKEPLRMLVASRIEEPIVNSGYAFLEFPVEEDPTTTDPAAPTTPESTPDDDIPDEFRVASGRGGAGGRGAGGAGGGYGSAPSDYYADYEASMSMQSMQYDTMTNMMGMMDPRLGGDYGYGGGGTTQVALNRNGRLYPYVSVRAVFNVRDQIRKIQAATHLSAVDAARAFRFMDFELERQVQLEPGLWSDWEPVQLQVAKDILNEVSFHNADVVSSSVTDPVITMPLPGRIYGAWVSHVTHPRLQKFVLSPEQLEAEMRLNQRILDQYIAQKGSLSSAIRTQGGFSDTSLDTRQMQSELMGMGMSGGYGMSMQLDMEMQMMGTMVGTGTGSGASLMGSRSGPAGRPQSRQSNTQVERLIAQLEEAGGDEEKQALLRQWIEERVTSDGQLLLFRYIDFDVRPGQTYRYRVRIEIDNPNYGRRASEADGINEVVATPTIWTEWSDVTPPAYVEPMVHYYLTAIDPPRGTRTDLPTPRLAFYQRSQTMGSIVHNNRVPVELGSIVGGVQETEQYDAAKAIYEEKASFTFESEDYLVSALPDVAINRSEHTDVAPPRGAGSSLKLTEAVVVVEPSGNLRVIDPVSSRRESDRMASYYRQQSEAEFFASMKNRLTARAGTGNPFGGGDFSSMYADYDSTGMSGMMEMMMGGRMQDSRRVRSGTRGGSGARGRMPGGPGVPSGPGYN